MEKLTELAAMGGYAAYVWPSFIIAAGTMLFMVFASIRSLRRAQKALAALQDNPSYRDEA